MAVRLCGAPRLLRLLSTAVVCAQACGESVKERRERLHQTADDIACDMCGFAAEETWATLVTDWSTKSERGAQVRSVGAEHATRDMLRELCHESSPTMEHFLELYDIRRCDNGSLCKKGQRWQVVRDEAWWNEKESLRDALGQDMPTSEDRAVQKRVARVGHLEVYQVLCHKHLLRLENDWADAIENQFERHQTDALDDLEYFTRSGYYGFVSWASALQVVSFSHRSTTLASTCD